MIFEPESLDWRAHEIIDYDRRYSTVMIYRGERLEGASPGHHRVAVVIPIGKERGGQDRILVDKEYVIEPKPNHFTIAVD